MKSALVTGVTGQDGAYLAEHLLTAGYRVFGTYRRGSSVNFWRLSELGIVDHENLSLVEYDLLDVGAACRLIERTEPAFVYNLAAQSFVGVSFEQPAATAQMTGVGPLNLLEAIRIIDPNIRFYQASSSEMYGLVQGTPQDENTPFYPRSPYAVAKLFAHWTTVNYRESFGIFGSSGILFNHESPLRGRDFVTRKITHAVSRISLGLQETLELGNLAARRDWGFAREYVQGMRLILEADEPDSYVLATNQTNTVRTFVDLAFKAIGATIEWRGTGVNEVGLDAATGQERVRINPDLFRPAEVDLLLGNYGRARDKLGWAPVTSLESLCEMMVQADLRRNRTGASF